MALSQGSRENVLAAMALFDAEHRHLPQWADWESQKTYKYALRHEGKTYPAKQLISLAERVDRNTFSGGQESIRYLTRLGFDVVPLRLPAEGEVKAALHELLLDRAPNPISVMEACEQLADRFALTSAQRTQEMQGGTEPHWENRVRQARRKLVEDGILDRSEHGIWRLAVQPQRYWIEKTFVEDVAGRLAGEHALGSALWSPTRSSDDADTYRAMRLVQAGDVVFHLVDDKRIAGVSVVAAGAKTGFVGLEGTAWAGKLCYRVQLRDYIPLTKPIEREEFFKVPARAERLRDILENHSGLFYNKELALNQGAYLTEAPRDLVSVFEDIFLEKTGQSLPHTTLGEWSPTAPISVSQLAGARRLFAWLVGDEGFRSDRYLKDERDYKVDLSKAWLRLVTPQRIEEALSADVVGYADAVGKLLTKTNLLPWRYGDVVAKFDAERATRFLTATRNLLFSAEPASPTIDEFNEALRPDYELLDQSAGKPASHAIPSLMLWLTRPDDEFFVRASLYTTARKCLLGSAPEGQGNTMSSAYYVAARQFARDLRHSLEDLGPRDMIDVQGFVWTVFSHTRIWLGGKTYDGTRDMLPAFRERAVYGVGFGFRPEIGELFVGIEKAKAEERQRRKQQLETLAEESGERAALTSFLELASSPGEIILAKSAWSQDRKSLLRISGVARSGVSMGLDPDLGHLVAADWVGAPDFVIDAGSYYPKVNRTLVQLPIGEVLEILGKQPLSAIPAPAPAPMATPTRQLQPSYSAADFCDETGYSPADLQHWLKRLDRKKQIVFQGPPGTGKTFIAERLARHLVSQKTGQWEVVQFHPSYSYEDFIQGIRPRTSSGQISYEVESGRLLDFCERARRLPEGSPAVLIIDEINRANLSRVFGELMYLLEYRDRELALAVGGKFSFPPNVYIIGTMNTADRSIALVDHALRRRFSFIHVGPAYDILARHLAKAGLPGGSSLVAALRSVNAVIDDPNYELGISFFMLPRKDLETDLPDIWQGEIEPYLEEFFFDQPEKVREFRWERLAKTELAAWVA